MRVRKGASGKKAGLAFSREEIRRGNVSPAQKKKRKRKR